MIRNSAKLREPSKEEGIISSTDLKSVCSEEVITNLRPETYTQSLLNVPNGDLVAVKLMHRMSKQMDKFGSAIHQNDHQARRRFVEWAQNEIVVVSDFYKRILFSDEAHFWLNGYVNKQNCRIWSEANPQVYVETPLDPEKLTVWCALWA
ncbi:DUF4817 domain-containing protein [Trichonephila clavipes]|nr:DUF4817 domain-containing protein [Trichonephila clavipes]